MLIPDPRSFEPQRYACHCGQQGVVAFFDPSLWYIAVGLLNVISETADCRWTLEKMPYFVLDTGRTSNELHVECGDAAFIPSVTVKSSDVVKNNSDHIFDVIVERYFPAGADLFWDTYIERGWAGSAGDLNQFLTDVNAAIKRRLYCLLLFLDIARTAGKPDAEMEYRNEFAQLILTAVKPLRCESVFSCHHGSEDYSVLGELFSEAVLLDLLKEAVLLFDTGSVCPREMTALAQHQDVREMMTGDVNSLMAEFLRKVLKQPTSLKSCARLQVAGLLGYGLKGKLKRAVSVGLPTSLWGSLVNLVQTKQYMKPPKEKYAVNVNKMKTDAMCIDSETDLQAWGQLIDF